MIGVRIIGVGSTDCICIKSRFLCGGSGVEDDKLAKSARLLILDRLTFAFVGDVDCGDVCVLVDADADADAAAIWLASFSASDFTIRKRFDSYTMRSAVRNWRASLSGGITQERGPTEQ